MPHPQPRQRIPMEAPIQPQPRRGNRGLKQTLATETEGNFPLRFSMESPTQNGNGGHGGGKFPFQFSMNGSTQNPLDAILNPPPPNLMNDQAGNAEADADKSANATQTPEKIPGLRNPGAPTTGSNDQTGGVAADEKGSGPAVAADHGTETPLPNSTGGAMNPQPDARQNPSTKFDSAGQREQTPDEIEALNRMKSIQQNIMQGAESFFDKARELENNGDLDGAKAADDSARSEKEV
jgi:hypothetical protein